MRVHRRVLYVVLAVSLLLLFVFPASLRPQARLVALQPSRNRPRTPSPPAQHTTFQLPVHSSTTEGTTLPRNLNHLFEPPRVNTKYATEAEIASYIVDRAHEGTIMLIPVNYGYIEFGLNLLCSLLSLRSEGHLSLLSNDVDCRGFVFVAMDVDAFDVLLRLGIPVIKDPDMPFVSSKVAQWGDPKFHSLVCTKLFPVIRALRLKLNVLLSDADIVFRKDPAPFFRRNISVQFSIGSCHRELRDNFDIAREGQGIAKLNTGFYFAQSSHAVLELFTRALHFCESSEMTGDQPAINEMLTRDLRTNERVRPPYTYGFFDGCLFANGCVFFKHLCANLTSRPIEGVAVNRGDPVMVHANFLVGKKEKVKHLQKYSMWNPYCIPQWSTWGGMGTATQQHQ